jgi:DNA-directed RNA polymerase specialized sigma24 family protein
MERPSTRTTSKPSGAWRDARDDAIHDLRRRIDRNQSDRIVARAAFLPHPDRVLLEAYFLHGRTVKDIALGSETQTRRVSRRLRRLALRVLSDKFVFVLRNLESWPPSRRRVARAMLLGGQSMREAAGSLHMTLYAVRRHHDAISAQFEMESDKCAAGSR